LVFFEKNVLRFKENRFELKNIVMRIYLLRITIAIILFFKYLFRIGWLFNPFIKVVEIAAELF
jgi:hypothetical protein